jgi:hypothetical protein
MEFFNKREDVIDLELTPYGEYLLSEGDFKPEFYAFFDDEILYDASWAGVHGETQNKIKDRIKEVPRTKTQYLFTNTDLPHIPPDFGLSEYLGGLGGKEIDMKHVINLALSGDAELRGALDSPEDSKLYNPNYLKHYALPLPLGNSSFDSEKAPSWDIRLLYNNITGSVVQYFTSSLHPYQKIPQLEVIIKYKTEAMPLDAPIQTSENNGKKTNNLRLKDFDELHNNPPLYTDGYYDFQEDFIVLEVSENNVPFLKENFDIEVFEVFTDSTEKYDEFLNQKYFVEEPSVVNEDGLLKTEKEMIRSNEENLNLRLLPLGKSYVSHYLNVHTDHEIDKDLMCQLETKTKQKGYLVPDPLDCAKDNEVNILSSDIYKEAIETTPECD